MTVIIKIMGGLASQMHKYAIGRAVADKSNCDLMLDLSWFNDQGEVDTKRAFHLDRYNVKYSIATAESIQKLKSNNFFYKLSSVARRVGLNISLLKKTHYVKDFGARNVLSLSEPIYIEGEWFGAVYFNGIRDVLLNDFTLKDSLRQNLRVVLKEVLSTESVAIHVRRGDYITNPAAASFHYLTGIDYYKSAVEHCMKVLENPVFFVFSDDPKWVIDAFSNLQGRFVYVTNNEPSEDLELIRTCRHQIICNSGFSWFGAWLNNYEGKINIAPKNWVRDIEFNDHIIKDLVKSKMIIL